MRCHTLNKMGALPYWLEAEIFKLVDVFDAITVLFDAEHGSLTFLK